MVTLKVGLDQSEVKHIPEDGDDHLYFIFMLQLLILNLLPHNAAKAYFVEKMLQWPY